MTKSPPRSLFSISKIYCSLFGHKYILSEHITHYIKEYTCTHCNEQATTNSRGKLEVMTPKLKEINMALASVHAKRIAKINGETTLQIAS